MRKITKLEFLTLYENNELHDLLITPIGIIAKTKPEHNKLQEIVYLEV